MGAPSSPQLLSIETDGVGHSSLFCSGVVNAVSDFGILPNRGMSKTRRTLRIRTSTNWFEQQKLGSPAVFYQHDHSEEKMLLLLRVREAIICSLNGSHEKMVH